MEHNYVLIVKAVGEKEYKYYRGDWAVLKSIERHCYKCNTDFDVITIEEV